MDNDEIFSMQSQPPR